MKGLCVSKGSVRGKAIIVDSVFATKTIAPGTILVMKTLDRKLLVSLSKNVVGVIAESGNIGSHGAGILRSLKIPCVLRIKDAVIIINDGQEIVIEGEKGEVHWCENEISQGKTAIHSQHGAIYKSIATEKFEVTDISVNREWYCPRPERAYQKLRFDIIAPVFGKSGKFLFGLPEATVVQNSFGAIVVKGAPLNVDICKFVLKNPEWLFQKSHERERVIQEIRSTLRAIEIKENSDSTKYYLDIIKIGIKLYRQLFLYSLMPRTKGSKNRTTASPDFDAQIKKLQKDKAMLEEGLSKTVAQIEELKTDIKSLRESLKPQRAEIKQTEKEIAKLETKKAAAEAKAAEAAKKAEAEDVLKKLLASGVTADEILEKLK